MDEPAPPRPVIAAFCPRCQHFMLPPFRDCPICAAVTLPSEVTLSGEQLASVRATVEQMGGAVVQLADDASHMVAVAEMLAIAAAQGLAVDDDQRARPPDARPPDARADSEPQLDEDADGDLPHAA